jgi:hypothetical protein
MALVAIQAAAPSGARRAWGIQGRGLLLGRIGRCGDGHDDGKGRSRVPQVADSLFQRNSHRRPRLPLGLAQPVLGPHES